MSDAVVSAVHAVATATARIDPTAAQVATATTPPRPRSVADRLGTTPIPATEESAEPESRPLAPEDRQRGALAEAIASRLLRSGTTQRRRSPSRAGRSSADAAYRSRR